VKTQIIQLDKNDDYISVLDKMSWIQTGHVLLVWPKEGHIISQQLELNLLRRHAVKLGARFGLVTHDEEVRFYSHRLDIPVFDTSQQAQETQWPVEKAENNAIMGEKSRPRSEALRQEQPKPRTRIEQPATRIISFGVCMLALLALGVFLLPSAKISLASPIQTQVITLSLAVDPSLSKIDPATNSIPSNIYEVVIEASDKIETNSSITIADKAASGSLLFENNSSEDVVIPQGLMVATSGRDPVVFAITLDHERILEPGDSVLLDAQAILPGMSGNLPADSLSVVEGELGQVLTVTNPDATHGGTDSSSPAPSQADLEQLRHKLSERMKEASLPEFQKLIQSGDTLIPASIKPTEVLFESASPALGDPGRILSLTLRVRFQAQAISAEELQLLAAQILDARLPAGFTLDNQEVLINPLTAPIVDDDGKIRWSIQVQRNITEQLKMAGLSDLVKGTTIERAMERLSTSLSLVEPAQISVSPNWWPRMPLVAMRIQVVQAGTK
jgi:Baseplate J-like protein